MQGNTLANFANTSMLLTEIEAVEREFVDIFAYITLMMNDLENGFEGTVNMDIINEKISDLAEMMSPEFLEIVDKSTIEEIISAINCTGGSFTQNATAYNNNTSALFK